MVLQNAQQNAQQLTRDQRRVLTLVNGQRTCHEIAKLLGFSPEAVYELLVHFRDYQLII
jgi:DNA-binding CsgD family transcriptional regulator